MTRDEELRQLKTNCFMALECLYIAVEYDVAKDVNKKVKEYLAALTTDAEKNEEKIHDCKNDLITCFEMQPDWMDSDLEAILKKYFGGGKP